MYKFTRLVVLAALVSFIFNFSSCASKKEIIYLQPDSVELTTSYELSAPKLQAGDILAISVTADDIRATIPFNPVSQYQGSSGAIQATNPFIPTYTIDVEGNIDFPKLGKLKLAGKTRTEAINFLIKELSTFIVNPGVSINLRNFRVTVLGEVARPGMFNVDNDRITILEALGQAGDMTIYGDRKDVLVIREQNGVKKEFRIDLTKRQTLNSPAYYLNQNDVVYVQPNGARVQTSKYTQNTTIFVSIVGLIITVISVLTR